MSTILVIDDDESIRGMLQEYLGEIGHAPLIAEDGEEALRLLEHDTPDLVICDVFMPHREGLSTIAEIRKRFPQMKIIVMSGGREAEEALLILELGKQFGATIGIQKPFSLEDLTAKIQGMLEGKSFQPPASHI